MLALSVKTNGCLKLMKILQQSLQIIQIPT